MSVIFKKSNILPTEQWTIGTDGVGDFNANGGGGENARVMGTDPFGNSAIVWQSQPSGNGNDDGGWNCNSFPIDEKELYRFSVWVKRISSTTGGTSYLGLNASANPVSLSSGAQMGNPYWDCRNIGSFTQDVWYLLVGHVFPSDHSGGNVYIHPDTAIYTTSGYNTSIGFCNIGNDLKWYPGTTYANHRAYHYYCNDNTSRIQWWEPRMDLCDGSEPKISDLLNNTRNKLDSISTTVEGASFKNQKIIATGGVITDVGEWRIHRFNSSGTFTLSSVIGSSLPIEYLVVGGGGGGGTNMGGGGGGGGVLTGKHMLKPASYTVTVGAGGAGAPAGTTGGHPTVSATTGGNSIFYGVTSFGGGWGGTSYNTMGYGIHQGGPGGSGGGSSGYNNDGVSPGYYGSGAGTSGQGYRGGYQGNSYYSGGGGGAGGAGADGNNRPDGGPGKFSGILGRPFYWGGGGGGAAYSLSTGGFGGKGGGGGGALGNTTPSGNESIMWGIPGTDGPSNAWANVPGGNGGTNTGGGGGGGSHYNYTNKGGDGGSGIVIIRYKIK